MVIKKHKTWACGIVTFLPDIAASWCQDELPLEGHYWWQQCRRKRSVGGTEDRVKIVVCHVVKQNRFMSDRVPHQQRGVGAAEWPVWGVRSGSSFSLCALIDIGSRAWLPLSSGLLASSWFLLSLKVQMKCENTAQNGGVKANKNQHEAGLELSERCRDSWKQTCNCLKNIYQFPLFFYWLYFPLYIQKLWFTQQWHHGDHSYFYWMVKSQLFSTTCPIRTSQQPPGKKVNNPKMIERWKAEYDTCMPCYCPRHVSPVKCLVMSLLLFAVHILSLCTIWFNFLLVSAAKSSGKFWILTINQQKSNLQYVWF